MATLLVENFKRGLVQLTFPYNPAVNEALKQIGGRWNPTIRKWTMPLDMTGELEHISSGCGLSLDIRTTLPTPPLSSVGGQAATLTTYSSDLRLYQTQTLDRAVNRHNFVIRARPGAGKTAMVATYLRITGAKYTLVVCPSIVLYTWQEELDRWWPNHPPVTLYNQSFMGKLKRGTAHMPEEGIVVVSYARLKHLAGINTFTHIIFDEMHYLASGRSQRGNGAQDLSDANEHATKIGLTGTLIPNKPENLHNQMNCIEPGRWGTWHSFVKRYCELSSNEYTKWIVGKLKPSMVPELRERLSSVVIDVDDAEVIAALPPFVFQSVILEPDFVPGGFTFDDIDDLDAFLETAAPTKVDKVCELVDSERETHNDRICVVVYHRAVAEDIVAKLEHAQHGPVYHVDGDQDVTERKKTIATASALANSILVCTMSSVGIGINDLVAFRNVILGELYWQPGIVVQLLGRFHRLSSTGPVIVKAIILKGTVDEIIAKSLQAKLSEMNQIIDGGNLEEKLAASIIKEPTPAEILEDLRRITSGEVK